MSKSDGSAGQSGDDTDQDCRDHPEAETGRHGCAKQTRPDGRQESQFPFARPCRQGTRVRLRTPRPLIIAGHPREPKREHVLGPARSFVAFQSRVFPARLGPRFGDPA